MTTKGGKTFADFLYYLKSKKTVYNAKTGLKNWRNAHNALKNGGSNKLVVNMIGTSITDGKYGGVTLAAVRANCFYGKIKTYYAGLYDDCGYGNVAIKFNNDYRAWAFTGIWAVNITGNGIMSHSTSTSENNATAVLSFNGTGIKILVLKTSAGGTVNYKVDGGSNTLYDSINATDSVEWITITGLSAGDHTLTLTKTDDAKPFVLIGAMETKGIRGIVFNNMGRSGAQASTPTAASIATMTSQNLWDADLTIIDFGVNEYHNQTSLVTYAAEVQELITAAMAGGSDVLLMYSSIYGETQSITQLDYINTLKTLAKTNNCAVIDIYTRWGGDYTIAKNIYGFIQDTVHPSIAGHDDIALALIEIL